MRVTVCAPPFSENIGGIFALHLLARRLQDRGINVGVHTFVGTKVEAKPYKGRLPMNLKWATEIGDVVVYPEIVDGNPLKAAKIVRWLLSPNAASVDGLLFHYVDGYTRDGSSRLCLFDRLPHIFYPPHAPLKREGACFTVRKGHDKPRIKETEGAEELGNWHPLEHWARTFRRKSIFYCYDDACFLSVLAAVCGCTSIVVPRARLTASEWRKRQPLLSCGVAYGMSSDETLYAADTMNNAANYLDGFDSQQEADVTSFIERVGA